MKATPTEPPVSFKPVTLQLTFESKQELDVFAALFCTAVVTDAIEEAFGLTYSSFCQPIQHAAEEAGADSDKTTPIANALKEQFK